MVFRDIFFSPCKYCPARGIQPWKATVNHDAMRLCLISGCLIISNILLPIIFYTYLKCTAENRRRVCKMASSNLSWKPPGQIKGRTKEKLHPLHQNTHLKINLKMKLWLQRKKFTGWPAEQEVLWGQKKKKSQPETHFEKKWTLPRLIYRVLLTPLPINQIGLCSLQKKEKNLTAFFLTMKKGRMFLCSFKKKGGGGKVRFILWWLCRNGNSYLAKSSPSGWETAAAHCQI